MLFRPFAQSRLAALLIAGLGLYLSASARPAGAQDSSLAEWPDQHWSQVAHRVPGFAGWWRDGGTIVLMLVDTTQRDAALKAITQELPQRYIHHIRVQKADFDFIQLREWKNLAIGDSEVVSSDADEVRNRIVAGVVDSNALTPVRARLLAMGIPPKALILEVTGPIRFH